MKNKNLIYLLIFISALAIIDTSYLTYLHYNPDSSNFCDINSSLSCTTVNKSSFAELTGLFGFFGINLYVPVPQSILGLLTFAALLILEIILLARRNIELLGYTISRLEITNFIFAVSIISMIFGTFLIYVQFFVIKAECIYCLSLDVLIFLSLILSMQLRTNLKIKPEISAKTHRN